LTLSQLIITVEFLLLSWVFSIRAGGSFGSGFSDRDGSLFSFGFFSSAYSLFIYYSSFKVLFFPLGASATTLSSPFVSPPTVVISFVERPPILIRCCFFEFCRILAFGPKHGTSRVPTFLFLRFAAERSSPGWTHRVLIFSPRLNPSSLVCRTVEVFWFSTCPSDRLAPCGPG